MMSRISRPKAKRNNTSFIIPSIITDTEPVMPKLIGKILTNPPIPFNLHLINRIPFARVVVQIHIIVIFRHFIPTNRHQHNNHQTLDKIGMNTYEISIKKISHKIERPRWIE